MDDQQARVVVHPWLDGDRRVTVDGELVGRAVVLDDLLEFLALAGMASSREALWDPTVVEWRGHGPETWGDTPAATP